MLTKTQKRTAQAIINIFETGEALGDYSKVTLIAGDIGHISARSVPLPAY
jgi:chitosanase